jgi:hypothetical protein
MYRTNWGGGITAQTRDIKLTRGQIIRQHVITGFDEAVAFSQNRWGNRITVSVAGQRRVVTDGLGQAMDWCLANLTRTTASAGSAA